MRWKVKKSVESAGAPSGAGGPAFEPEGGYSAVDDDDIPF